MRAWHCGLTERVFPFGHVKVLFLVAQPGAAARFCVDAGKANI